MWTHINKIVVEIFTTKQKFAGKSAVWRKDGSKQNKSRQLPMLSYCCYGTKKGLDQQIKNQAKYKYNSPGVGATNAILG